MGPSCNDINTNASTSPLESKESRIHDLSQQLKQWRSQLFSNLHPNDLLPSERNFRTTVHLHIHYHWAWILMGRASLLQLSRERIQALSKSTMPTPDQSQSRQDLATLCVDAAKATIQLVLVLKKHNLLCRFSFTDQHASSAALIILILHSILQHGDETSKIIDDGVDMLRYMARGGCRGPSSVLQTIEQLRRLASNLREKIYQDESDNSNRGLMQPTSITNSYQAWVNWMSEQEPSKGHISDSDSLLFPLGAETLHDASEMLNRGPAIDFEASYNDNMLFDYLSLDPANMSCNFDAFSGSMPSGEIPRGFEWDDGRLDVLNMTQLLDNYTGQTTYGPG